MSITVKRLLIELEKIENKFLEVEVLLNDVSTLTPEIFSIKESQRKVLIFLERKK